MKNFSLIGGVAVLALLVGCYAEQPAIQKPMDPLIQAALSYADKADENQDKVVSKCLSCSLAMDGKAEHKVDYQGYAFHMCSSSCVSRFQDDADGMLKVVGGKAK